MSGRFTNLALDEMRKRRREKKKCHLYVSSGQRISSLNCLMCVYYVLFLWFSTDFLYKKSRHSVAHSESFIFGHSIHLNWMSSRSCSSFFYFIRFNKSSDLKNRRRRRRNVEEEKIIYFTYTKKCSRNHVVKAHSFCHH